MPDKVSVIIVNWNGELFLERCLAALMNLTVKPHEIILVDNASSDRSLGIARRFPSARLIALERNTGFVRGNTREQSGDWGGFGRVGIDRAHQSR